MKCKSRNCKNLERSGVSGQAQIIHLLLGHKVEHIVNLRGFTRPKFRPFGLLPCHSSVHPTNQKESLDELHPIINSRVSK